jgi:hypothetical protein
VTDPHVQAHLLGAVHALRGGPAVREALLDRLEAYAHAGRFPRPDGPVADHARQVRPPRAFEGPRPRAPIFVDAAGTRCAVGHLLDADRPDLVAGIRARANGAWLLEMDEPGVGDWAAAHGFTLDELAWIQPSYCDKIEVCEEVSIDEAPIEGSFYVDTCEGPSLGFGLGGSVSRECRVCDGALQVWAVVSNAGTLDAVGGSLRWMSASGEVLGEVNDIDLPAGWHRFVGPFELDGTLTDLRATRFETTLEGDCWPEDNVVSPMGSGHMGDVAEPDACGGDGCASSESPYPPIVAKEEEEEEVPRGCGSAAPLALVGLFMRRRRVRR